MTFILVCLVSPSLTHILHGAGYFRTGRMGRRWQWHACENKRRINSRSRGGLMEGKMEQGKHRERDRARETDRKILIA